MKDLEQIKSEAFDMCTSIDAQLGVVLSGLDALDLIQEDIVENKADKADRYADPICYISCTLREQVDRAVKDLDELTSRIAWWQ